jgi:predicted small integral membrane protein
LHDRRSGPQRLFPAALLLLICALPLAAQGQPQPQPQARVPVLVLSATHARGDEVVVELIKSAFADQATLALAGAPGSAELVASLDVQRSARGTTLDLTVNRRSGSQLVRSRRTTPKGQSLVGAAQELADEVAQAVRRDVLRAEALAKAQAQNAGPGDPPAPEPERPRPAPAAAAPLIAAVPAPQAEPAPEPRRARGDDGSGGRKKKLREEERENKLDFLAGVEVGGGPILMDPAKFAGAGSNGYDLTHYGAAFASGITGKVHPGINLHAGVGFLEHLAFEIVVQGSRWEAGSAWLTGGRFTGFPLQVLLPDRKVELGLEFGTGYSFVRGGAYDMSGAWISLGATCELPLSKWLGVTAYYRLLAPLFKTFYVDDQGGRSEPTSAVSAGWHTLGVGLNVHPSISW